MAVMDTPPELPVAVRTTLVQWAAETLGQMPAAQVPPALARVARFTPAKRARLGATALAAALQADPAFRAAVADRVRTQELVPAQGHADPVRAAATAHLLGLPDAPDLLAAVAGTPERGSSPELADLRRSVRVLQRDLARVTAERDAAVSSATAGGAAEVDKLRQRLRDQGTRLRAAEQTATTVERAAQERAEQLQDQVRELTDEVVQWQEKALAATGRADRAQESLGRARDAAGVQRAAADRRLDLLLTTVEGAVSGLRREWSLAGGGPDPADVVAAGLPGTARPPESTGEPSRLHSWLVLPAAHLVVDGYNVTKTGYPELTLAQQRDRLVRSLGALAARTSADITVVFDGSGVIVPAAPRRGVRVLFSPSGVIADDLIRDLVEAEPVGRVVVVVSSDREVAEGVRRRGARTAGAPVLLGLLG